MEASKILNKLATRTPQIMGQKQLKKSAVLLPLLNIEGETHILFEVRAMHMRSQPGDICFPGGRIDQNDKSPMNAAIRETVEELGVRTDSIQYVTPLDYIVNDSQRIIYPFAGKLLEPDQITPNPDEVSEVFTVPLDYFLNTEPKIHKVHFKVNPEEDFPFDLIVGGKDYKWSIGKIDELFYQYDGKVIWGLTAKILTHFIQLLKSEGNC